MPDASIDAAPDTAPPASQCEQQHLVCGKVGTESCGTCAFTASCLPEQTGCLAATEIRLGLGPVRATVELEDRRVVFTSGTFKTISEVTDAGVVTVIDSENGNRNTPILTALGRNDRAVFWTYEDGTIRTRAQGGDAATLTKADGLCVSVAATDAYVVCGLVTSDARTTGVYRYALADPTVGTPLVLQPGLNDVKVHGDVAYHITTGGPLAVGPLGMAVVSTLAPIAVTPQLPAFVAETYGVVGDRFLVRAGATAEAHELWSVALDGSAAARVASLDGIEVIGLGQTGPIVRPGSTPTRIGVLPLATGEVETLIEHADYDIQTATSRGAAFWFIGATATDAFVLELTR